MTQPRPVLTTLLALLLAACASQGTATEPAQLQLSLQASDAPITPRREGNSLVLGESRIQPWPYEVPTCQSCELQLEYRHYPEGPDIILRLYQNNHLKWRLIQSHQPAIRLNDGSQLHHLGNHARWTHQQQSQTLQPGQTTTWQGCQQHLHWLTTTPNPDPGPLSNEAPTRTLQLTTNCP